MSSLGSLYIGASGLSVHQAALNITAHNLANVDTEGYVRQQALLTDLGYNKVGDSYISVMKEGLGANFATVKQIRDAFLDKSYRQETGREAFYTAQCDAVSEIESFFGELEGESFQNTLNSFWTSMQELAKEPDSVVTRASFIQTAVSFVERATNISDQLKDYQVNLNTQIQDKVDRINEIGNSIKDLNYKIRKYESGGAEKANDYRDQRNLLLDELGKLANISYKENSSGMVNVNLEGSALVSDETVFEMQTVKISQDSEMIKPVWESHGGADVFNMDRVAYGDANTDIGSLRGLLTARGNSQVNYTDIPKRENYETDDLYNAAVKEYNNTINPSVIMTVQAEFDQLIHGITTTVNNVLSPIKEVTLTDGSKVKILDTDNAPVGLDDNKTMGEALFNRKSTDRFSEEQELQIVDETGATQTITARVYNEEDPADNYTLFTAGEIEINPNILQNYSYIPLSSNTGSGDFDAATVNNLLESWQDTFSTLNPNTLTKNNFTNYYNTFISDLANRGQQYNTISSNQSSMAESINSQRSAVTGVSSDDELTNMIKYQQGYNASARYLNVVSEMLKDILDKL